MRLRVDVPPMEALELFYEGETLGVSDGDFIKNEKQRNLKLPKLLKEFLSKYAYTNINRGRSQLWLPDKIDTDTAKVDGELREILIIGTLQKSLVAILADSYDEENPMVLLDDLPEEDSNEITLVFNTSELSLAEYIKSVFIESPSVYDNSSVCEDPEAIRQFAQDADKNLSNPKEGLSGLIKSGKRPGRHICWDEIARQFVVVVLAPEREILVKFIPCFAIPELERMFTKEFYENSENCDYAHALKILKKLIDHYELTNTMIPDLSEKYKLAGRCCWALKRWQEAEKYYNRAEHLYKDILTDTLEKVESFYEGLGNFYFDKEDIEKSQKAYNEVDRLGEFAGKKCSRLRGGRLVRQAMLFAEGNQLKRAIELYDQALTEYQNDPKDCKYDIARCQQLRGEAKRKLKEKLCR